MNTFRQSKNEEIEIAEFFELMGNFNKDNPADRILRPSRKIPVDQKKRGTRLPTVRAGNKSTRRRDSK